jgi:hypothetical protein
MASCSTRTFEAASTYYNSIFQRNPAYSLIDTASGAFYASPVPLPASAWLLAAVLGGLGAWGRRLLRARPIV